MRVIRGWAQERLLPTLHMTPLFQVQKQGARLEQRLVQGIQDLLVSPLREGQALHREPGEDSMDRTGIHGL